MEQTAITFPPAPKKRRGGPGRPATRRGTWVEHRPRPWHDGHHPVHVTLRVRRGIPSLRGYRLAATIVAALRVAATSAAPKRQARRESFRIVHFSIQPDHLHLIVEATGKVALARGMQGLASGLARRVNRQLRRRGPLFADRYHGHAMSTPTEVRRSIVYVLKNFEKHAEPIPDRGTAPVRGVDPCSSAPWFGGWAESMPASDRPPAVSAPRTWLLSVGWQRSGGPIGAREGTAVRPGGRSVRMPRRMG
jgi:REP element-mobilizing transposase RayT